MSKEEYGSDWWYSTDFIFKGNYQRMPMTVVAYHPPGTLRTEKKELIKEPVIELRCKSTVKKLSINVSNRALGSRLFGEALGPDWVGKELSLEVRMILYKGEPKTGIRIVPVGRQLNTLEKHQWYGCKADLNKRYGVDKYKGKACVVELGNSGE